MSKAVFNANKTKLIMKCIKATTFLALYVFFWFNTDFYRQISEASGVPTADFFKKRIVIITAICLAGIAISFWEIKISEKLNKWILIAMVALTPVVNFLTLEYVNIRTSRILFTVFKKIGIVKSITTILIIALIMLGIYIISNSLRGAAIGVSIIIAAFGATCYFVYEFRGIPLLASDFSTMDAAISVMNDYNYRLSYQMFAMILITLFWCVMLSKLKKEESLKKKVRIGALAVYVIIMATTVYVLVYTPFVSRIRVSLNTFQPQKSYGSSGSILAVIRSVQLIIVEKPEGYSLEQAENIAAQYPAVDVEDAVKPNVIVVMDEAFSDFQAINNFKTNKEVLPFFNGLKENVVRGELYVSGFGGKTANSEFEVLTGCSQAFTPPSSTPYQLFIKDTFPSLTYALKNQGYQGNIAMHPYGEKGYNRKKVYPLLGFDKFLSIDDFKDAQRIRHYVSDEATFDRIIQEYEEAKKTSDAPFFTLDVTMQNHSAYDKDYDNLPKDIEILDDKFKSPEAERYLNLIHLSDKALEKLIAYFEAQEEPTVIVFFGDHQPKLSNAFYKELFGKENDKLTDEELMEKYKTPFMIWANYDIEERENVKTSANYLSSLLVESSKMQTTGWNNFLLATAEEVPVLNILGYFGADGKFYDREDETSPYYELIKNYQMLQYNNMFDKGNRVENFFE